MPSQGFFVGGDVLWALEQVDGDDSLVFAVFSIIVAGSRESFDVIANCSILFLFISSEEVSITSRVQLL